MEDVPTKGVPQCTAPCDVHGAHALPRGQHVEDAAPYLAAILGRSIKLDRCYHILLSHVVGWLMKRDKGLEICTESWVGTECAMVLA